MPLTHVPPSAEIVASGVEEVTGRPAGQCRPEDRLVEDLKVDSLDFVRLVQVIEESCGIRLEDDRVAGAKTLADLTAAVDEARGSPTA